MFTFVTHCLYAVVALYGYKGMEHYRTQKALGVPKPQAIKSALIWPKSLLK